MQYRANYPGPVRTGCSCCSGDFRETLPEPFESEICNGKAKRKKPRPKKEKCPVNGTHEWYKEWTTHEFKFTFWPGKHYRLIKWSEEVLEHTCIHCWKVKLKRYRTTDDFRRQRKRTIPKRPVKF